MKTEITSDIMCGFLEHISDSVGCDADSGVSCADAAKRIRDLTQLLDDAYICINGCEAALAGLRVKHQAMVITG